MTKYDFFWRLFKFLFVVATVALIVWQAMGGNSVAIAIVLLVAALFLMLAGAAVVSYSNQLHTKSLLSFMQVNAKENKTYMDAMKSQSGGGAPQIQQPSGGLLIVDTEREHDVYQ